LRRREGAAGGAEVAGGAALLVVFEGGDEPVGAVDGGVVVAPVAGVGKDSADGLVYAGVVEHGPDGGDHGLIQADVVGVLADLGSEDDVLVVDRGLGVEALHPAAGGVHDAAVGVGGVGAGRRRRCGLGRLAGGGGSRGGLLHVRVGVDGLGHLRGGVLGGGGGGRPGLGCGLGGDAGAHCGLVGLGAGQRRLRVLGFAAAQLAALAASARAAAARWSASAAAAASWASMVASVASSRASRSLGLASCAGSWARSNRPGWAS
jgi:hypothetical protein